jgi:hypothetical protein
MRIDGIDNLTPAALEAELAEGGRFVHYEYCISLLVLSLRCPTGIRYLRPGEIGLLRGLPYALISLLLGWWGLPWGPIYTPLTIFTNLCGGHDVTDQVCDFVLAGREGAAEPPATEGPGE